MAILWFVYRYLKQKQSLITLILWTILWLFVILFAIFPRASEQFARLFGITRGLDFIIIAVFVVLFYIIFGLFNRVDRLQDEINKIVKEVAINNEISLDDEEDELKVPLSIYDQPRQSDNKPIIRETHEPVKTVEIPKEEVKPANEIKVKHEFNPDELLFDEEVEPLSDKPKINVDKDSIIVNDNNVISDDEFFDDFFDE